MKRKRKLNHHKPNHNGINRKTGKRVPNNRALEPGDGYKKNKPKKDISVDEAERRDLLKQKRAEHANLVRQDWLHSANNLPNRAVRPMKIVRPKITG